MLREGQPLEIYSTDMAREDLTTGNPVFNILQHYCGIHWHRVPIEPGRRFPVIGAGDLSFTATPVASKPPPYSPHRDHPRQGDNIGIRISDPKTGRSVFYAPGLVEIEAHIRPFPSRKVLIHINNTNPILNEDSPQHRELEDLGIEVAYDGMDISL